MAFIPFLYLLLRTRRHHQRSVGGLTRVPWCSRAFIARADSGHPWVLYRGHNSWGSGPLVEPGRFSPLVGSPGFTKTCLQAQLLSGSQPSWSRPSTPTSSEACGALFTPRACHMAQALPAGTVQGSGLGEGVFQVPGLSQDPAFWIWGPSPLSGCTPES